MPKISEQKFRDIMELKLGVSWDRANSIFNNFGPKLAYDVINVLLHAIDQEKVDEVLDILEKHYESHLQFQHPEIRGTVCDRLLDVNLTQEMFIRICQQVLKLQPNRA